MQTPSQPPATPPQQPADSVSANRITAHFAQLRARNAQALIPFICGGSPTPDATAGLLRSLDNAGADIIEVGIPFSDPIADGPVIAAAMHHALTAGATPQAIFDQVASVRGSIRAGLVAMISVSLVQRMGGGKPAQFVSLAKQAGFDGLIVPDVPLEESVALAAACAEQGLCYIQLVSPTTPAERIAQIVRSCSGFVYILARVGITGSQAQLPNIAPLVARVRTHTNLPVAVGFGVSTAQHVETVWKYADGAIVGSALVRELSAAAKEGRDVNAVAAEFVKNLSPARS
jgi:tryptophan synthase alpha chain